jgi:hypothetical protein
MKAAPSDVIWRSSLQTLTCCCSWSAVGNHIRRDSRLQIKGHRKSACLPSCVTSVYCFPRYTGTIIHCYIMQVQLLHRWQHQSRKLWIRLARRQPPPQMKQTIKLHGPESTNELHRLTTAPCRRNLVPTFVDRGASRGQRGGSPPVVNLSFLDRSRYFSFK